MPGIDTLRFIRESRFPAEGATDVDRQAAMRATLDATRALFEQVVLWRRELQLVELSEADPDLRGFVEEGFQTLGAAEREIIAAEARLRAVNQSLRQFESWASRFAVEANRRV